MVSSDIESSLLSSGVPWMDLILCCGGLDQTRAMCRHFELQPSFTMKLSLRRLGQCQCQCHCPVEAFAIDRAESSGVRIRQSF